MAKSISGNIKDIPRLLPLLSIAEQEELLAELDELAKLKEDQQARDKFLPFVRRMWPGFIEGAHFNKMANAFERIAAGDLKRLIICMPPRHGKSRMSSYLFPAWYLGKFPDRKVIQASNTADLAEGFGRDVRNLVATEAYHKIFPGMQLRTDSKAAGRWDTTEMGTYYAIGTGGTVTGRGADVFIIDDPHSEQQARQLASNPGIFDGDYDWYTAGPRQRLQPGGSILIIATRWSKRDLIGRVLKDAIERGGEEWEVIEFPAFLPSGDLLWPQMWGGKPDLYQTRDTLLNFQWQAQYQQNPISEEAALIKREWWKTWDKEDPPDCDFTLMTFDTAFEKTQRADYSAMTYWGVFYKEDDNTGTPVAHIILLDAWRDKVEFPDLKKKAIELYKKYTPDSIIIEKKASGAPLIYEMRAMGIPVSDYTPTRGNDKISRLNAVADIFASGRVWAPSIRWAEEVIDEVAEFPSGEHDDYVDTVTMSLARFRKGGYVGTALDEPDEPSYWRRKVVGYY